MAKNFDVKIRATNGDAAAAAIKQFVDEASRSLGTLQKANENAAASSARAAKSIEETTTTASKLGSPETTKRIASLGENFNGLEHATKKANRGLNDAVGTFQLFGAAAGSAGTQLSGFGTTIGNVSDVFGTLANLLSKNPLVALGSAVALVTTAFVAFKASAIDAVKSQEQLQGALEKTNALLLTQAQRSDIALEAARKAAKGSADVVLPNVTQLQRQLDIAADTQKKLDAAESRFTSQTGVSAAGAVARGADEKAKKLAADARAAANANRAELTKLQSQLDTLNDPTKFAQRELLNPGAGSLQFRTGGSREDLSESDAVAAARAEATAINEITGAAKDRQEARDKAAAEEARKAAEQRAQEIARDQAAVAELERRIEETTAKKEESVSKFLAKLEEEARLGSETNEQREVGLRIFEAQSKLVDDLGNKMRDLTATEKQRIEIAVKTKNAYDEQAKAAEKVAQEIQRAAQQSTDRLVDLGGDTLFDALTGKVTNFWDNFKNYGLRVISQLAAEMVFRPIIAPIVTSIAGAAPGLFGVQTAQAQTSSGGLGSLLGGGGSSPLSSLFSGASSLFSSATGGGGGILQSVGGAIGGLFGGGASVAGAGAMVGASAVGGPAFLGGATSLGATAGLSGLAATGIGALVAIPALLAISGIFGKKTNVGPFASSASILNPDGSLTYRAGGQKNGGSAQQQGEATAAFATAIKQVAGVLGIRKLPGLDIGAGTSKQTGQFFGTGGSERGAVYFGQDTGIAGASYVRRLLQGTLVDGQTLKPSTEAARLFARTSGDVKADLEFVTLYQSLDKAGAAASTVSTTLDELNAKFDDYVAMAKKYGFEVERIEKARADALDNAVSSLLSPLSDRLAGIRGLIDELSVGASSPLSPEKQLEAARSQFQGFASTAMTGDENSQRLLGNAGRSYLDVARSFFGTTEQYASIFGDVVGQLGDLLTSVRETDPTVRAIVETGEKGTAAVTKLLGSLVEEVTRLREEVRRGNDLPLRLQA